MHRGNATSVRLEHPGVVHIYCSLHPWERATVFVAPSPWFAVGQLPDPYEIPDVPAGRYRLKVWGEGIQGVTREVTVRGGEVSSVRVALRSAPRGR
jgi:hypothetical protein